MDSPLDLQQIASALAFWAAAFSAGLWIAHGAGLCGRARSNIPRHLPPA